MTNLLAAPAQAAELTAPSLTAKQALTTCLKYLPFTLMHVACLAAFWVGVSRAALITMAVTYAVRMFAITGFYHRYFSHRTFKTSRVGQFIFALLGTSAVQHGPMWWAAHHGHHHAHADQPEDLHSPAQHGFLRSHFGWFLRKSGETPDMRNVRDWLKFPELRMLDKFDMAVPVLLALGLLGSGLIVSHMNFHLHTATWQLLVWGFFVSTVLCWHATYTINSLSHVFGRQRYKTRDTSRNNWFLALLTFGEGWHNNHHYYPSSTRQGFYWYEVDLTFYGLKLLSWCGVIWDLKSVSMTVRDSQVRRVS